MKLRRCPFARAIRADTCTVVAPTGNVSPERSVINPKSRRRERAVDDVEGGGRVHERRHRTRRPGRLHGHIGRRGSTTGAVVSVTVTMKAGVPVLSYTSLHVAGHRGRTHRERVARGRSSRTSIDGEPSTMSRADSRRVHERRHRTRTAPSPPRRRRPAVSPPAPSYPSPSPRTTGTPRVPGHVGSRCTSPSCCRRRVSPPARCQVAFHGDERAVDDVEGGRVHERRHPHPKAPVSLHRHIGRRGHHRRRRYPFTVTISLRYPCSPGPHRSPLHVTVVVAERRTCRPPRAAWSPYTSRRAGRRRCLEGGRVPRTPPPHPHRSSPPPSRPPAGSPPAPSYPSPSR